MFQCTTLIRNIFIYPWRKKKKNECSCSSLSTNPESETVANFKKSEKASKISKPKESGKCHYRTGKCHYLTSPTPHFPTSTLPPLPTTIIAIVKKKHWPMFAYSQRASGILNAEHCPRGICFPPRTPASIAPGPLFFCG